LRNYETLKYETAGTSSGSELSASLVGSSRKQQSQATSEHGIQLIIESIDDPSYARFIYMYGGRKKDVSKSRSLAVTDELQQAAKRQGHDGMA
jgi:hypothetical protein